MAATHSLDHPTYVENCWLCKMRSVSVAPAAMPTRQDVRYSSTDQLERNWKKDIPAYKELVKQGIQPEQVDGCHDLALTATKAEDIGAEFTPPIVDDVA